MKLYGARYLALMFGLALHSGTVWSSYQRCNPNNPPTLKRITNDMIANRWFIQNFFPVLPNNGLLPSHFLTSYNIDFRSSGKMIINGKTVFEPQQCLYEVVEANINPKRATFTVFFGSLAQTVEVRILDTDFHNWIVTWFCYRFDHNNPNQCTDYIVNYATVNRDGILSQLARKQLEQSLKKTVCRRDLPPASTEPQIFCDRLGKSSDGYGRKRNYW